MDDTEKKGRDAEISVWSAANLIERYGAEYLMRRLDDGRGRILPAMKSAWVLSRIGASNPLSRYQSLDIAAELLGAWAETTGRADMPGFYKRAGQRLATETGLYIK